MADQAQSARRVLVIDADAATAKSTDDRRTGLSAAGLIAAINAHPAFEPVIPSAAQDWDQHWAKQQRVDLVGIVGRSSARGTLIEEVLGGGHPVLAVPVTGGASDRLLPLYPHRYAPTVRSAAAALAAGRVGLPWNVQVDFVFSTEQPAASDLFDQAAGTVDAVLSLLRLPIRRVYVPAAPGGVGKTLTIQCDHDHDVLSTIVVGSVASVPGDGGFGPPVLRHRYRIAGSHGELLVDALRPRVRLARPSGHSSRWDGPTALSGLLDAVAAGTGPGPVDVVAVQQALRAARRSVQDGRPVELDPVG